jgi:uncharacterized repeat protein (TIGR03803 family)
MSKYVSSTIACHRVTMLASAALAALTAAPGAQAQTLWHQFTGNPDGAFPHAKLLTVSCSGTNYVFGTTQYGGNATGEGVVFSQQIPTVGPPAPETVIHQFSATTGPGNPPPPAADGGQPTAGLIQVGNNLYGTTQIGGVGVGTVYSIPIGSCTTPQTPHLIWDFTASVANDGRVPAAGLLYHGGLLYGTTVGGGTYGQGTVFECKLTGPCKVIYNFGSVPSDGINPYGGLIIDSSVFGGAKHVALYGTTELGGTAGLGTVFRLTLPPAPVETVLHSFTGVLGDGAYPMAELLKVGQYVYSTTYEGGTGSYCAPSNCGTVFRGPLNGPYATVYSFTGYNSTPALADGAGPMAGLAWDAATHAVYGTTFLGGSASSCSSGYGVSGCGTVFKLVLAGETVKVNFNNVANGIWPEAGLILNGGNLYGTTIGGELGSDGTVFSTPQ